MTDPELLNGRRIHAILYLQSNPLKQSSVTGVGLWDGTQLSLVPDSQHAPFAVPLFDGRAPVHELTSEVRAMIATSDADNAETLRHALSVADYLAVFPVATLPDWATPVADPLAMAWVPGWRTT